MKAAADAADRFFLANGTWPATFDDLDIGMGQNCASDPCKAGDYSYRLGLISSQGVMSAYKGPGISANYFTMGIMMQDKTISGVQLRKGDIVCVPRANETDQRLCRALGGKTMYPGASNFFTSSPFYVIGQ